MHRTLARRRVLVIVVVSALAVVGLWLFFAQSTDLDASVMDNYRDSTPQQLKDLLRPFRPPEVLAFEPKDFVIQPCAGRKPRPWENSGGTLLNERFWQ